METTWICIQPSNSSQYSSTRIHHYFWVGFLLQLCLPFFLAGRGVFPTWTCSLDLPPTGCLSWFLIALKISHRPLPVQHCAMQGPAYLSSSMSSFPSPQQTPSIPPMLLLTSWNILSPLLLPGFCICLSYRNIIAVFVEVMHEWTSKCQAGGFGYCWCGHVEWKTLLFKWIEANLLSLLLIIFTSLCNMIGSWCHAQTSMGP